MERKDFYNQSASLDARAKYDHSELSGDRGEIETIEEGLDLLARAVSGDPERRSEVVAILARLREDAATVHIIPASESV